LSGSTILKPACRSISSTTSARRLPSTLIATELFEISIFPSGRRPLIEPTWAPPRFE
jgi:hypothetical protein